MSRWRFGVVLRVRKSQKVRLIVEVGASAWGRVLAELFHSDEEGCGSEGSMMCGSGPLM